MKLSATPANPKKPTRIRVQTSQTSAVSSATRTRIEDRHRLVLLRKWVNELHDTHGFSFESLADHTWRGKSKYGYFQSIAAGKHLGSKPQIRPVEQDYIEVGTIVKTVRTFGRLSEELFTGAMNVVKANADLNHAVAAFLEVAGKRAAK